MSVIYVVLPIALVIVGLAVAAFVWSVRTGQLDDLETPAVRMLYDEQQGSAHKPPRAPAPGNQEREE